MCLYFDFLCLFIVYCGLYFDGVLENSMVVFCVVIVVGYGIECDIQVVVDGMFIVFYDDELLCLIGVNGLVCVFGMDVIFMLCIMGIDEVVLIFVDVLVFVVGCVFLLIEIKD